MISSFIDVTRRLASASGEGPYSEERPLNVMVTRMFFI